MGSVRHLDHRLASPHQGSCLLLANPLARGVERAAIANAAELLGLEGRAIREVGRDGGARSLAEEAVRRDAAVLAVAGGDGTLHEAVQALAGSRTALAIVPLGTSNDLAGRVGIPSGIAGLRAVLDRPRVSAFDLLEFGGVRVATVGGMGLPAYVANRCNHLRARPPLRSCLAALGRSVYTAVATERILRHGARATAYTVGLNDGPATALHASAILFGLTERFGGGMRLAPDGATGSGTFAALFVGAKSRSALLQTLLRIKLGRPAGRLAVSHSGLTRLTLHTDSLVGTFGDGEWLGVRHRVSVVVEPGALRILVPRDRRQSRSAPVYLPEAV